jgi:hypothetical protein
MNPNPVPVPVPDPDPDPDPDFYNDIHSSLGDNYSTKDFLVYCAKNDLLKTYATGDPTKTYFKVVYRRDTNFAMDNIDNMLKKRIKDKDIKK